MADVNNNPRRAREIVEELKLTKQDLSQLENLSNEAIELALAAGYDEINENNLNAIITTIDTGIRASQNNEITVEELVDLLKSKKEEDEVADDDREKVTETEGKLESKVPDRELLKQLLEEYDDYQAKHPEKTNEEIIGELGKKNRYQQIRNQIQKAIERKQEIERDLKQKRTSEQRADNKEIIKEIAKVEVIAEFEAENKGKVLSEESRKIVETRLEAAELSREKPEKKSESINILETQLKKDGIGKEEINRIIEASNLAEARIEIDRLSEETTSEVVTKLTKDEPLNQIENEKIKEIVKKRVEMVIMGEVARIDEPQVNFDEQGKERVVSLEEEIERETGKKIEIKSKISGDEWKTYNSNLENYKEIEAEKIGLIRREETVNEIFREISETPGVDQKSAWEMAVFSGELIHGQAGYPEAVKVDGQAGADNIRILNNVLRSPLRVSDQVDRFNKLKEEVKLAKQTNRLPRQIEKVDKLFDLLSKNPALMRTMQIAQNFTKLADKINMLPAQLAGKAVSGVAKRLGFQLSSDFVVQGANILSGGFSVDALKTIANGILNGGIKATTSTAATATTTVAATGLKGVLQKSLVASTGVAAKIGAALGLSSTGVGLVLVAAQFVLDLGWRLIKKVGSSIKDFFGKIGRGIFGDRIASSLDGGVLAGIGAGLLTLGGLFLAIPKFIFINIAMIGTVFVVLMSSVMGYSLIQSIERSKTAPPPMEQTNCTRIEASGSPAAGSGDINCNQNVGERNVPGVDRQNFFRMADQWKSGKNYARECFNDVVCRARSQGVDETFALWVWLHESGASNYSIDDVEDFGIHGQASAPPKNFNAQIEYFLKLNHGNPCTNLDYWLGWATAYQTGQYGSSCDPDKPVDAAHPNNTGRNYLAAIKSQWSWISSNPMPAQARKNGTGESCGSGAEYSDDNSTYTYTDENGDLWLCKNEPGLPVAGGPINIPEFPAWDPNTPVPEGCPDRLPSNGGHFTQGPYAPNCSHQSMSSPAIDIGIGTGNPIYATHPGVASLGYDRIYGFYVDLHGSCEGKAFTTRYAHMPEGGFTVESGQTVKAGDRIGTVNNTGSSTGPHIHYHISGLDRNRFGQYMGLSVQTTQQLWGCCGSYNGKYCP